MQIRKKRILANIYKIFLGMFGFSILGQYILLDVLQLPFSLVEIFFIPIIWIKRKSLFIAVKRLNRLSFKQIVLYFLLLFGFLYGTFATFDFWIILSYRSIIYMIIGFVYMQKQETSCQLSDIWLVSLSAIIGETIYVVIISTSSIVSSTNVIAIALAIFTAFMLERYIMALGTIALSLFLTINTGFRIGIVIVVVCTIEMLLFTLIRKDRKNKIISRIRRGFFLLILIIILIILLNNYEQIVNIIADLTGMSTFAVFRTTERMRELLSFNISASQDTGRLDISMYAIQRLPQIFPRGLIGESIGEYWLYIDNPLVYLYDLFGSIATIGILVWLVMLIINNLNNYILYSKIPIKLLCIWMIPVLLILFVVNGSFMVIVYQAIETGLILGILSNKNLKVKELFNNNSM